jgi:hypothetical protein
MESCTLDRQHEGGWRREGDLVASLHRGTRNRHERVEVS